MKQIAKVIGALVALTALVAFTSTLLHSISQVTDATDLLIRVSIFSASVVAIGFASERMALAIQVYLIRGKSALAYAKPSDCVSFSSWLCSQWNFISRGGRQDGFRIFGVEVAVKGSVV